MAIMPFDCKAFSSSSELLSSTRHDNLSLDHELCFDAVRLLGLCVEHALGFRAIHKLGCDLRPNSPAEVWRIRRLVLTLCGLFFQHHFHGEFDRRHVAKTRPARTDFGGALKGAQ